MFSKELCRSASLLAALLLCVTSAAMACTKASPSSTPSAPAAVQDDGLVGPGPRPVDQFHPDNQAGPEGGPPPQPEPAYGGRAILHLESMPKNFNRAVENSSVTRNLHFIVHESLVARDWESWEFEPRLCTSWDTEDMLVLTPEAAAGYPAAVDVKVKFEGEDGPTQVDSKALFGRVVESGGEYGVEPISEGNPLAEKTMVPAEAVSVVERGTVFTFYLRDDVVWHPAQGTGATGKDQLGPEGQAKFSAASGGKWSVEGHKLDARDVRFSWELYQNPDVDCDEVRFQFVKVTRCDVVDPLTVRMFYESQYFAAIETIGVDLSLLPSHVYDLSDPENPMHDPSADARRQARHINEEPHNQMYVGLGPYRIAAADQQWVKCSRFDDYFLRDDPRECGYFDDIWWRMIDDDNAAYQALINGELDYFQRVKSSDYFGAATQRPEFVKRYYKGYFYYNMYGYNVWNLYQPQFADQAVRTAIAHAFDFEAYKRTNYQGLAQQVTGPFPYFSTAYDHSVKPYPHDPSQALEILEDAGWFDSDGNGIVDRDGVELSFEFLMPSGNDASKNFGLKLQESLGRIGIKMDIAEMEWATFLERIKNREFDSANLAWISPLEPDPEQTWHSKWGQPGITGSNNSGLRDTEVDRLIEAGQRELDNQARTEIWHRLHARLYELQPYLFMYNVPRKFALNRKIRGFQAFAPRPGFYPRRWYYPEGTPGTRPTVDR